MAGDARVAAQHVPVVGVDRGGVHLQKHVPRTDVGLLRIKELEAVRRAESLLHDRFHRNCLGAKRLRRWQLDPFSERSFRFLCDNKSWVYDVHRYVEWPRSEVV